MESFINWLFTESNYTWIFSGIGVFALGFVFKRMLTQNNSNTGIRATITGSKNITIKQKTKTMKNNEK